MWSLLHTRVSPVLYFGDLLLLPAMLRPLWHEYHAVLLLPAMSCCGHRVGAGADVGFAAVAEPLE
jgi:hypothetical protein